MNGKLGLATGCLLFSAAFMSGCLTQGGGIAPSTLPITENDAYVDIGPISGSDGTIVVFGLPLLPVSGHKAIEDAKAKSGGDALIEVTAENQGYLNGVSPIGYYRIKVAGKAIKFQRGAAN